MVPFGTIFEAFEGASVDRGAAKADVDALPAVAVKGVVAAAAAVEVAAVGVDGPFRLRPFFSDVLFCRPPFLASLGGGGPIRAAGAVAVRAGPGSARPLALAPARGVVAPPFTF